MFCIISVISLFTAKKKLKNKSEHSVHELIPYIFFHGSIYLLVFLLLEPIVLTKAQKSKLLFLSQ